LATLNREIRLPLQLHCLTSRKLLYKLSKSTNIFTNTSICTHGGSQVPTTPITHSKVVHSYTISENIYIVWNVKKLVRSNLISLFSEGFFVKTIYNEQFLELFDFEKSPKVEILLKSKVFFGYRKLARQTRWKKYEG